jgi:hypothetical protein
MRDQQFAVECDGGPAAAVHQRVVARDAAGAAIVQDGVQFGGGNAIAVVPIWEGFRSPAIKKERLFLATDKRG